MYVKLWFYKQYLPVYFIVYNVVNKLFKLFNCLTMFDVFCIVQPFYISVCIVTALIQWFIFSNTNSHTINLIVYNLISNHFWYSLCIFHTEIQRQYPHMSFILICLKNKAKDFQRTYLNALKGYLVDLV